MVPFFFTVFVYYIPSSYHAPRPMLVLRRDFGRDGVWRQYTDAREDSPSLEASREMGLELFPWVALESLLLGQKQQDSCPTTSTSKLSLLKLRSTGNYSTSLLTQPISLLNGSQSPN